MSKRQSPRERGERVRVDVWMPVELRDAARAAASAEHTDFSDLTRRLLIAYLKKKGRLPNP